MRWYLSNWLTTTVTPKSYTAIGWRR